MKMKSILLSMLALASLAGCQKDNETINTGSDIPVGVDTYATFQFNVDGTPKARAAHTEENGSVGESAIKNIRLLIFNGQELDAKLEANSILDPGATKSTLATTSGPKRVFVIVNSGTDNTTINAALEGLVSTGVTATTLEAFYAMMTDAAATTPAPPYATDMGDGFKELLKNGSMLMSNVADLSSMKVLAPNISADESANASLGTAAKNNFEFIVKRAVAKGNLTVSPLNTTATEIVTADNLFTLKHGVGEITYAIRNINRSTHYVQLFEDGHNVQSNGEGDSHVANGTKPASAYFEAFDTKTNLEMQSLATYDPYFFNGYASSGAGSANAKTIVNGSTNAGTANVYFAENNIKKQVLGNTTYFSIVTQTGKIDKDKICASFTFDAGTSRLTTTAATDDYTGAAPSENFWLIRDIPAAANIKFNSTADERRVFTDETVAWSLIHTILSRASIIDDATIATGADLKTAYENKTLAFDLHKYFGVYKSGLSYYRLNIYEQVDATVKRHYVRRNHVYSATVTGFKTIGEPTEEDLTKNPETPVDAEQTNVTATIKVQQWHNVAMSDEL